jgi:hypothetical protein
VVEEGIRTVTPNPDPNKPTPELSGIPVKTHVNDWFGKFARTFLDNAICAPLIWLSTINSSLPDEKPVEKVARYEAHPFRGLYKALRV